MAKIDDFRAQHPEYGDMDDETLAQKLHAKSYSDMPYADFRARFIGAGAATAPQATPPPTAAVSGGNRTAPARFNLPIGGDPTMSMAANAAMTLSSEGNPLKTLAGIPGRFGEEVGATVRGIGPAIAGTAHLAGTGLLSTYPGLTGMMARQQFGRAAKAAGEAFPEAARELGANLAESIHNPIGAVVRRPLTGSLDMLAAVEAPSVLASLGARTAARAGAATAAKGLAQASERSGLTAIRRAVGSAAEERIPAYGAMRQRGREMGAARTIFATRGKEAAARAEAASQEGAAAFGGLRRSEREPLTEVAMGTASLVPGATRPPTLMERLLRRGPQPVNQQGMEDALAFYRQSAQEMEAANAAQGLVNPNTAYLRRFQPARLAMGDPALRRIEGLPNDQLLPRKFQPRDPALSPPPPPIASDAMAARIAGMYGGDDMARALAQAEAEAQAKIIGRVSDANPTVAAQDQARRLAGIPRERGPKGRSFPAIRERELAEIPPPTPFFPPAGPRPSVSGGAARRAARSMGERPRLTVGGKKTAESMELQRGGVDPSYVPMLPTRGEKLRSALSSLIPQPLRASKPGFLRRSKGSRFLSGDYERDLGSSWAQHQQARITYDKNRAILDDLSQQPFSRPVRSVDEVDWQNESLIAPDQFRGMGRAMESGDPEGMLNEMASSTVSRQPGATPTGRLYAIPKHVAREIEGQLRDVPDYLRVPFQVLFDTPNNYLRWTALTLRPGFYVNNLFGNAALSGLAGTTPRGLSRAADSSIEVPAAVRGSGFGAVEMPRGGVTASRVGQAMKLPHVANEAVDDFFRKATFLSDVEKQAAKKTLLESGTLMDRATTAAQQMDMIGPEGVAQAVQHTNDFLNDYARQSPFQRRVLRRLLPFQSFLVHMARLTARMPVTYPGRAALVARMSELANEYKDQQWEESGVDPENVASWRENQLPIGSTPGGQTMTLGTMGLNPASGLGFSGSDMTKEPSGPALLRALMEQAGPVPQFLMHGLHGETSYGRPLTKPGVKTGFGEQGPVPSLLDLVRQNTPAVGLAERALQPQETYDLVGSPFPWRQDYLPARKDVPRKYGFAEQMSGYLGVPLRGFDRSEVTAPPSERKRRKRKRERSQ